LVRIIRSALNQVNTLNLAGIKKMNIQPEEMAKILGGNAQKLLKITG